MSLQINTGIQENINSDTGLQKKTQNTDKAYETFDDYFRKGHVRHIDGARSSFSDDNSSKNSYFRMSKDGVTVNYNGVTFLCNHKTGALELGDCSQPNQCIRVPLEKGGSLLFNPDSIGGINEAIGMFSAEDQGRIMRAIQMYNIAEQKLKELEEDENATPEDAAVQEIEAEENAADDTPVQMEGVILREMTSVYEIYDIDERFAAS